MSHPESPLVSRLARRRRRARRQDQQQHLELKERMLKLERENEQH